MDRISFVKNVYDKITEVFLDNIPADQRAETGAAYLAFLHRSYDRFFQEAAEDELNRVAAMCAKREKTVNLDKDADAKRALLFPDAAYTKLEALSLELAALAARKKEGQEVCLSRSGEEYIAELSKYNAEVGGLFRYSADRLYSEAILDVEYLFKGGQNLSFRTAY